MHSHQNPAKYSSAMVTARFPIPLSEPYCMQPFASPSLSLDFPPAARRPRVASHLSIRSESWTMTVAT